MFQDSESGRYECEFEVRNVIKPEELEDRDTEVFSILEHGNTARNIQAVRDHIKIKKEIHGVRCGACDARHGVTGAYSLC